MSWSILLGLVGIVGALGLALLLVVPLARALLPHHA
jgi:hypothetical protein